VKNKADWFDEFRILVFKLLLFDSLTDFQVWGDISHSHGSRVVSPRIALSLPFALKAVSISFGVIALARP